MPYARAAYMCKRLTQITLDQILVRSEHYLICRDMLMWVRQPGR